MQHNGGDTRRLAARPAVVLVWSYKGGQGRSWTAANAAYWLARRGHRVLLTDLDYRAPGLPYFALNMLVRPDNANLPPGVGARKEGLPADGGISLCFLEAIVRFWYWARERPAVNGSIEDLWRRLGEELPDVPFGPRLNQLVWQVPFEPNDGVTGAVYFAPCGDITDANFQRFVGEGNPFRQVLHPRSDPGQAAQLRFTDLLYVALARMAENVHADFVVIDLPAGVSALTEMLLDPPNARSLSELFRFAVPGVLLAVTSPAAQAIDGTRQFLNGHLTQRVPLHEPDPLPPVLREQRAFILFNMQSEFGLIEGEELDGFDLKELTDSQRREILTDPQSREFVSDWAAPEKDVLRILDRACFSPWIPESAFREFVLPVVQTQHHRIVNARVASRLLASEIDTISVKMRQMLHVVGTALQRFLNRGHLVPPATQKTESIDTEHEVVLFGEDVPAFRAFCEQLSRSGVSVTAHFGKHEDLLQAAMALQTQSMKKHRSNVVADLATLGIRRPRTSTCHVQSARFTNGQLLPGETATVSNLFGWIFERCHIAAFPHYLLGHLWTNHRERITSPTKVVPELRSSLDVASWAFVETCTYRGQWLMLPLTLLAKLLVVRNEPTAVTRWTWPQLRQTLDQTRSGKAQLLTESKRAGEGTVGLSLWYEWNQFLISCGAIEVSRDEGHDLGRVLLGGNLQKASYLELLDYYRQLVNLNHPRDRASIDWEHSGDAFHDRQYAAWLGWTDWLWKLSADGKLGDCGFLPLPRQEAVFPSQPVEGWGLVITKLGEEAGFLPDLIHKFLAIEWQILWQAAGGCSPFIDVIRNRQLQAQQPWLLPTASTLERVVPKGKTANVPLEIAAVAGHVSQHLGDHRQVQHFDILRRLLEELVDNDS